MKNKNAEWLFNLFEVFFLETIYQPKISWEWNSKTCGTNKHNTYLESFIKFRWHFIIIIIIIVFFVFYFVESEIECEWR